MRMISAVRTVAIVCVALAAATTSSAQHAPGTTGQKAQGMLDKPPAVTLPQRICWVRTCVAHGGANTDWGGQTEPSPTVTACLRYELKPGPRAGPRFTDRLK